jgi:hypothetical protein
MCLVEQLLDLLEGLQRAGCQVADQHAGEADTHGFHSPTRPPQEAWSLLLSGKITMQDAHPRAAGMCPPSQSGVAEGGTGGGCSPSRCSWWRGRGRSPARAAPRWSPGPAGRSPTPPQSACPRHPPQAYLHGERGAAHTHNGAPGVMHTGQAVRAGEETRTSPAQCSEFNKPPALYKPCRRERGPPCENS